MTCNTRAMKTYSMNDYIYFKLTPKGKEIWETKNRELNEKLNEYTWKIPYIDKEWAKGKLWQVIQHLEKAFFNGYTLPIYDITFENPLEDKMKNKTANDLEKIIEVFEDKTGKIFQREDMIKIVRDAQNELRQTEDKMKKDEFEQIEKLVLQLREIDNYIEKDMRNNGHNGFMIYPLIGCPPIIMMDREIWKPALLMYAEKLKAELKELGYEDNDEQSSNP